MAEQTIDRLSIEIDAKAEQASKGIDSIIKNIERLKKGFEGGIGETNGVIQSINRLKEAFSGAAAAGTGMEKLAQAMTTLRKMNTDGITKHFKDLSKAMKQFSGINDISKPMKDFGSGVGQMAAGLKILQDMRIQDIAKRFEELTAALRPFIEEMAEAGGGVINFGSQMKAFSDAMRSVNNMQAQTSKQTMLSRTGSGGGMFSGISKMLKSINLASVVYLMKNVASAVKNATQKIGGYVNKMSDYIENVNLFTVSMGSFTDQATEFTDRIQNDLGFDSGEAMRYMGVFQQLSTSFGVSSDRAYVLSKNLTQLGLDFASFFNLKTEDAFQKLQSGISGEIEPLRALGIDISNTRLQQELYNLGINQSVESLSQADKETLRYIAIMKQAGNVAGDTARSITSPANALRMLQSQLDITARQIGSIFIPMLNKVIPYLTAFAKIIGDVAARIAAFFGFEMPTFEVPKNDLPAISEDLEQVGQEAQKTAKKMNFLIGGFDELNRLEVKQESAASNLGTGNILGDIALPEYDIFEGLIGNSVDQIVERIKNAFAKLKDAAQPTIDALKGLWEELKRLGSFSWDALVGFYEHFLKPVGLWTLGEGLPRLINALKDGLAKIDWQNLVDHLNRLWDALAAFTIHIGEGLLWVWENVLVPIGVWTMNEAVPAFLRLLTAGLETLNIIIEKSKPAFEWFWENFLLPLGQWAGEKIINALDSITEQIRKLGEWVSNNEAEFTELMKVILEVGSAVGIVIGVFKTLNTVFSLVQKATTSVSVVTKLLTPIFGSLSLPVLAVVAGITLLVAGFIDTYAKSERLREKVSELGIYFKDLWERLKELWGSITELGSALKDLWDRFAESETVKMLIEGFYVSFVNIVEGIIQRVEGLVLKFQGIIEFLTGVFTLDWDKAWGGIQKMTQSSVEQVKGVVHGLTGTMTKVAEESAAGFNETAKREFAKSGTTIGDSIFQNACASLEIHSPSKKFMEVGQYVVEGLNQGVSSSWQSILNLFSTKLTELKNGFVEKWNEVLTSTQNTFTTIKETISNQLQETAENVKMKLDDFQANWREKWDSIKTILSEKMSNIKTIASERFSELKTSASSFISEFKSSWSNGMNNIRSVAQNAFGGIKNFASSVFSSIQSLASSMISRVRDGINALKDLVSQQNKVQAIGEYAGNISSYNRSNINNLRPRAAGIPALAGGGVIREPTYALVGEYPGAGNNPEIVAPQSTIEESVVAANGELVGAMLQMTQMMIAAFREGQGVSVQIDGKEVGKASAKYMRDEERRTGKNPGRL